MVRVALGCLLMAFSLRAQLLPARSRSGHEEVTFSNQIIRIFQKNCQVCHRPGDIAPFSLMTYEDALSHARSIRTETAERRMPPWKPVPGYGEFLDERRLSQHQVDLIGRWVDAGAPEGDPRDLPTPAAFPENWAMGTPDLVLEPQSDFTVPGESRDVYRCFSIPMGLLENQNVIGVDVRPGNRSVVHHVVLFQDATGASARLTAGDSQPGYNCFGGPGFALSGAFGVWVPGQRAQMLPEGMGIRTTAGARVVMQVHYHPSGTQQSDRTRVGFYFSRGHVRKEYSFFPVYNDGFVLPAGDPSHTVRASLTIPPLFRVQAVSITPHMHLLGRQMHVDAVSVDGARRPLIFIDDWDFDWQGTYFFKQPIALAPLTRVEVTAVYDNSADNLRNPNSPPRDVRWGEQSTDEMCIAVIGFTLE